MDGSTPLLTIVIPVLNEEQNLSRLLDELAPWRALGDEIIVVDGGSSDNSVAVATPVVDRVVRSERSRAKQQNAGVAVARGSILWFVHADSGVLGVYRAPS
jgi:glycosyltransferase involved in cell wall biosynthesis